MTSNLGSDLIDSDLPDEVVDERVMGVVRSHFRPEFLNRVDDVVVFSRLSRSDIRQIVGIQFAYLKKRLEDRKISVELADAATDWLTEHGYDPAYGARPLKRLIQTAVADPLSLKVLNGELPEGSTVTIGATGDELTFS
jgi:ATP-dependent Clp protease ATP-binding subunit ClpB